MKVELCNFSGHKIYPSKGKLYVRGDSKVSLCLVREMAKREEW
jgi:ribosomal protein L24E